MILAGMVTRILDRNLNKLVHTLANLVSPDTCVLLWTIQQRHASRDFSTRYSSIANSAVNHVLWKKKIVNIPMEAYMQNDLRAGSCVVAPIPKAMKSVMEVMVMATPACSMVLPSLSTTPLPWCCSDKVFRHWTMTNMS